MMSCLSKNLTCVSLDDVTSSGRGCEGDGGGGALYEGEASVFIRRHLLSTADAPQSGFTCQRCIRGRGQQHLWARCRYITLRLLGRRLDTVRSKGGERRRETTEYEGKPIFKYVGCWLCRAGPVSFILSRRTNT